MLLIHRLPLPSVFPSVLAGNLVYLGDLFLSTFSYLFNVLYIAHIFTLVNQIHHSNASNTKNIRVFNFIRSSCLHHHFTAKSFQFFLNNVSMIQLFLLSHSLMSLSKPSLSHLLTNAYINAPAVLFLYMQILSAR